MQVAVQVRALWDGAPASQHDRPLRRHIRRSPGQRPRVSGFADSRRRSSSVGSHLSSSQGSLPSPGLSRNRTSAVHLRLFGLAGCRLRSRFAPLSRRCWVPSNGVPSSGLHLLSVGHADRTAYFAPFGRAKGLEGMDSSDPSALSSPTPDSPSFRHLNVSHSSPMTGCRDVSIVNSVDSRVASRY